MKKTYISPQVEVMKFTTEQLLANSPIVPTYQETPTGPVSVREDNPSNPNVWDQEW